jgi:hypothetical protein
VRGQNVPPNSEVLTKLSWIPSSMENKSVTTNKSTGFTHLQIERNPWLEGYHHQTLFSLPSVLNQICWSPSEKNSWVHHWERKVSYLKCYPDTCLEERRKAIKTLRLVNQSGDYDSHQTSLKYKTQALLLQPNTSAKSWLNKNVQYWWL